MGLGLIDVPSASIMESRVERTENDSEARVVSGLQEVRDWVMGCSKEWKKQIETTAFLLRGLWEFCRDIT